MGAEASQGGPGGWWILGKPEIHFGEHVVVPDIAGWRRERLSVVPDKPFMTLAPDWVCEVLAPSTEPHRPRLQDPDLRRGGVGDAWLVKPSDRTLEVLRLRDGAWTIVGVWQDSAVVRASPFEAVELELGRLWADATP